MTGIDNGREREYETERLRRRERELEQEYSSGKARSLVGIEAPTFEADALLPDGSTRTLSLDEFKGRPILLLFYALDFSCVCPTEIVAFSDAADEFEAENVQLLGVSVDSVYAHAAWAATPRSLGGVEGLRFPLLADLTKRIAAEYGVLACEKGTALRTIVLIDADGIVQASLVYGSPFGPSVEETLRLTRALARHAETGETCPTDWRVGESGILEEEAEEYYRERFQDEEDEEFDEENEDEEEEAIEEEILEVEISGFGESGASDDFEKMKERDETKDEKREKKERKEEEKTEKKKEKEKDK